MNLPIWAIAALFVGTAMSVWLLVSSLERRSDLRRRFQALSRSRPVTGEAHPVVPIDAPRWVESVQRYAEPLASLSMPEQDEEISALRRRLRHAGWRAPSALQAFVAARTLLAVMLPALAWIGCTRGGADHYDAVTGHAGCCRHWLPCPGRLADDAGWSTATRYLRGLS